MSPTAADPADHDREMAELVVRTLTGKARDAGVPTEPFDPTRRTGFTDGSLYHYLSRPTSAFPGA